MENVISLANQIGDVYTKSKEYKEYMALYEKLKTNEELMQALVNYRVTKINNFVNNTANGLINDQLDQTVLSMHQELAENEDMREMLALEDELLRVLSHIYKVIGEKCVLNIDIETKN